MLKSYLLPLEDAVSTFWYLALWLLLPIVIFHYRRFGHIRYDRATVFYLFLLYSLCSIFLIFLPLPEFSDSFCQNNPLSEQLELTPFRFIDNIVKFGTISLRKNNWLLFWNRSSIKQAFYNFLLLMPLGFFLRYYFRVNFKNTTIISLLVTLSFEVTQITGIFGIYPCAYRTFDVDDLILNTSGAIVGYIITSWFRFLPDLKSSSSNFVSENQITLLRRLTAFLFDWFAVNTIVHLMLYLFRQQLSESIYFLLEIFSYLIWFVVIPYFWQGQTLGKRLLLMRLIDRNQQKLKFQQLLIRYSLILIFPLSIDRIFLYLFSQQLSNFYDNLLSIIYLLFLGLEIFFLVALIILRKDRLALHDLLSNSQNTLIQNLL